MMRHTAACSPFPCCSAKALPLPTGKFLHTAYLAPRSLQLQQLQRQLCPRALDRHVCGCLQALRGPSGVVSSYL